MTSFPRYGYSKLDEKSREIRLLTLLPGVFDDPVHILLQVTSFTDDKIPNYEAISYAWGSTDNPKTIRVGNAVSNLTMLEVTNNLAQALPYLRYRTEPRTLWIDAVCVNQQDLIERGSQVKRMPDLFSKAKGVVVWLGPEGSGSAMGLNLLQRIGSKIVVDWIRLTYATEDTTLLDSDECLVCTEEEMIAIAGVLNRPWFERLWIVQEICLAPPITVVQCGDTIISWQPLSNAIFYFHTSRWIRYNTVDELAVRDRLLASVEFVRLKNIPYYEFRNLLEHTRKQKCSDPRDRIYAITSLAKDLTLEPDYTKSAVETFKDFVLFYLRSTANLDIILSGDCNLDTHEGPSWVPDWSNIPPSNKFVQNLASGESKPLYRHERDTLTVQGILVGTIGRVEPFALPELAEDEYSSMASQIRRVACSILGPARASSVSRQDLTSLAQTLIPNGLADRFHPIISHLPNLEETRNYLASLLGSADLNEHVDYQQIARVGSILGSIHRNCHNRVLYVTGEGHLGLGPKNIQSGDQVAILPGCSLPAALRPSDNGTWQMVGETYLDGFSVGESILGPLPDGTTVVGRHDGGTVSWAYLDDRTGALDIEDPRLGSLPTPWARKKHSEDDRWTWYVNTETGEERKQNIGDPRLDYDELLKLPIALQEFVLV